LLIISDYDILSILVRMPSIETYINFYPRGTRTLILLFRNILASLNIVGFISFLATYLFVQQREKQHVGEQLAMVSRVNIELKNYANLTEKIGEDNERKRISREIHDTLGHALTGISAGVDACIALIDIDPEKAKKQLLLVSDVVRVGIKDVRRSLYKLRPGALEDSTLKDGLTKMIAEYEGVSNLKIDLHYNWDKVDMDNTKEDIIFRMIQESITNSLRHGHASEIEVNLFIHDDEYIIIIQDNGMGCENIKYGYGLKQMRERVSILNGTINFSGENGFRTAIQIPIEKGAANYD
jgi:signal transduction histidine kinase